MISCNPNFIFMLKSYDLCFFGSVFLMKKMCSFFQLWNIHFQFVNICRRGNRHFDVHLLRITSVHLLSKEWMDASYEGRNERKSCFFPARVGNSNFFMSIWWKYFFHFCTLTWRVNNCFPPGKGINRRNKCTKRQNLLLFGVLRMLSSTVAFIRFSFETVE